MEVLFLLLISVAQYEVCGTMGPGQAALRQSSFLSERYKVIAQGIRTFHAQNTRVAASKQFQLAFMNFVFEDVQKCAEEVTTRGVLLQRERGSSCPDSQTMTQRRCPRSTIKCTHWIQCGTNPSDVHGMVRLVGGKRGGRGRESTTREGGRGEEWETTSGKGERGDVGVEGRGEEGRGRTTSATQIVNVACASTSHTKRKPCR